jgi:hypothetical protein
MNSYEFRNFIEGKPPNDDGIISISQDIVFNEELIINYTNIPVEFTGKTVFNKQVTFDNTVNFTFKCSEFKKIVLSQYGKLNLTKCKIDEIYYKNQYTYDERAVYGKTILDTCNVVDINLDSFFGRVIIKNNKIFSLKVGGSFFLDFDICGIKSKNSIKRFNVYGNYGFNDNKRQINISNCIIDGKEKSFFAAKGLDIKLTDVDFISDVELNQPFNTFECDESVQFEKLNISNISHKTSESISKAVLKGFKVKQLCFLETYDRVILEQLNIGSLKLNEAKELKTLTILRCNIADFIVSSNVLKSLEILGSEKATKIGLLKYDNQVVPTYADGFGEILEITRLEFSNCTIPKDLNVKFYNIKLNNLSFKSLLNYGNTIFLDIKKTEDGNKGLIEFYNSDLGKAIFMNCNFKDFTVRFSSSKINEIFLAGTDFPAISDENYITISGLLDYEQKILCYTQLKKIYDSRGDSLNSTKFHKAELEAWEKELQLKEKEKSNSKIDNWLKKIKLKILNWIPLKLFLEYWNLKILNWISLKLFPEYWNLSKENLDHKKLIFSQYKKMYEGRGDTVKAIEYQGKELDVHRTILCKEGGRYLERLQLSLNKYSNNFGQSWHWAVCWIIGLGIFIYFFYCHSLGFTIGSGNPNEIETFNKLFSYFFEFINPIRKGEFIQIPMFIEGKIKSEYVTITGWARFIDFIWRIIITYLGYQLIQAFRKYSKKTS